MAGSTVKMNIKNISGVSSHYAAIESTNEFSLIVSSLESIIRSRASAAGFKESLKVIMTALVDAAWQTSALISRAETEVAGIMTKTISRNISKPESLNVSKFKDFSTSMHSEDLHLISEFSYSKGPTFPKQKRVLGDQKELIPGPSDYNKNPDVCLVSSPKITIPKSVRNIDFSHESTPAPGSYNPIKYFSSRKLS